MVAASPLGAAQNPAAEYELAAPAQIDHGHLGNLDRAMLMVPASPGSLFVTLEFPAGSQYAYAETTTYDAPIDGLPPVLSNQATSGDTHTAPIIAFAQVPLAEAGISIYGHNVSVDVGGLTGFQGYAKGQCWDRADFPDGYAAMLGGCALHDVVVGKMTTPGNVSLHAANAASVMLQGWNFTCITDDCIPDTTSQRIDTALGPATRTSSILFTGGGNITATTDAYVWTMARRGNLDVPATATLPIATCTGSACPVEGTGTQFLQGPIQLHDLRFDAESNRMTAQLAGTPSAVRVDEGTWQAVGVPVAAIAIGAVLLYWLSRLLWTPLAARLLAGQALESPKRRDIYDVITAEPGITLRSLNEHTGISEPLLRHHIAILQRGGHVQEARIKGRLHFTPANATSEASLWLLQDPEHQRLVDLVADLGHVDQGGILAATKTWGWSRGKTQYRLRGLVDGGALARTQEGRRRIYTPASGHA